MTRTRIAPVVAVLALVAAGCGGGGGGVASSALIGEYAIEKNGELTDFVRIDRQGDRYVFMLKEGEAWTNPATVTPLDQARLEALLQQPVAVAFEGFSNGRIALFKLPEGARIGKFESQTGYAWAYGFGLLVDLHRR